MPSVASAAEDLRGLLATWAAARARNHGMWLIHLALRRPFTVLISVLAVVLGSGLVLVRIPVNLLPNVELPRSAARLLSAPEEVVKAVAPGNVMGEGYHQQGPSLAR